MNFLLSFDIFTLNSFLQIHSNKKVASYPGLIASFLVYAFLLYSFLISDMIKKTNPKTTDQITPQTNNNLNVELSNENFFPIINLMESFSNFSSYNYLDPTIWSLYFSISSFDGPEDQDHQIPIVNCSEVIQNENFGQSLCIKNETRINLNYSSYFHIEVRLCSNFTQSNVICKPYDEIIDFVKKKVFHLRFLERSVDLENYESPINEKFTPFIWTILNPEFSEVFFSEVMQIEFSESKNILFEENKSKFFFQQDYRANQFTFYDANINGIISTESAILVLSINLSPNKRVLTRRYQKLTEILGELGGLLSISKLFGSLFLFIFPQIRVMKVLMNTLYFFPRENRNENALKKKSNKQLKNTIEFVQQKNTIKEESETTKKNDLIDEKLTFQTPNFTLIPTNSLRAYLRQDQENNIQNKNIDFKTIDDSKIKDISKKHLINDSPNLLKNIENIKMRIQEKKNWDFSLFSYFKHKIKSFLKFPLDHDGKNVLLAEEIFKKEIDFVKILQRLQDIEKIKYIFLNPMQMRLFDLMKPVLSVENNKNPLKYTNITQNEKTYDEKMYNIIREYEDKIRQNGSEISEVDKKILEFFQVF